MSFCDTARYADGPAVVAWLDSRRIVPRTPSLTRAVNRWRHGSTADVFNLDAILVKTIYNLCDLPEEVWLDERRPSGAVKGKPHASYPQLNDRDWLNEHYSERGLGCLRIAKLIGCTHTAVRAALMRHGIRLRSELAPARVAA